MENDIGAFHLQRSLIYSFHMPFFFLASGFFFKEKTGHNPLLRLKSVFIRRIVPVVFFNGAGIVFFIITSLADDKTIAPEKILFQFMRLVEGYPVFNYVTWFLICLFSVECINTLQHRFLGGNSVYYSVPFFAAAGYYISLYPRAVEEISGIPYNFWYTYSAVTALAFYQSGILFKKHCLNRFSLADTKELLLFLTPLSAIWIVSAILNLPHISGSGGNPVVLVNSLKLGHFAYFYLAAFAGSLSLLILSRLIPVNKTITYFGGHTLILLGLQGIIHAYMNKYLVFSSASDPLLFIATWAMTLLTFFACRPFLGPIDTILRAAIHKLEGITRRTV